MNTIVRAGLKLTTLVASGFLSARPGSRSSCSTVTTSEMLGRLKIGEQASEQLITTDIDAEEQWPA